MSTGQEKLKSKCADTVEKAKAARRLIWKHNSFFGHCEMARRNMQSIIDSHTATDDAKITAASILLQLAYLADELKERKPL